MLTSSIFESHRGSRGLPSAFSDCLMYFFHLDFAGVATCKPSLELFSGPKNKKTLNAHISKSLLAPKGLFPKTLQRYLASPVFSESYFKRGEGTLGAEASRGGAQKRAVSGKWVQKQRRVTITVTNESHMLLDT